MPATRTQDSARRIEVLRLLRDPWDAWHVLPSFDCRGHRHGSTSTKTNTLYVIPPPELEQNQKFPSKIQKKNTRQTLLTFSAAASASSMVLAQMLWASFSSISLSFCANTSLSSVAMITGIWVPSTRMLCFSNTYVCTRQRGNRQERQTAQADGWKTRGTRIIRLERPRVSVARK